MLLGVINVYEEPYENSVSRLYLSDSSDSDESFISEKLYLEGKEDTTDFIELLNPGDVIIKISRIAYSTLYDTLLRELTSEQTSS